MTVASHKRNSHWKDGFLFLGNNLALDFLNTRPVQNGEPKELLPDFGVLLRWFRAVNLLSSGDAACLQRRWQESGRAQRAMESLRAWREKLREEVRNWEARGTVHRFAIDYLNRVLADHPMRTKLTATRSGPLMELYFEPRQPEDLIAPVAHSAATLFATEDHKRVRKCRNCVLHFRDTSKKGSRQWCRMQLCGNRFKVAAYAARKRMDFRASTRHLHV